MTVSVPSVWYVSVLIYGQQLYSLSKDWHCVSSWAKAKMPWVTITHCNIAILPSSECMPSCPHPVNSMFPSCAGSLWYLDHGRGDKLQQGRFFSGIGFAFQGSGTGTGTDTHHLLWLIKSNWLRHQECSFRYAFQGRSAGNSHHS